MKSDIEWGVIFEAYFWCQCIAKLARRFTCSAAFIRKVVAAGGQRAAYLARGTSAAVLSRRARVKRLHLRIKQVGPKSANRKFRMYGSGGEILTQLKKNHPGHYDGVQVQTIRRDLHELGKRPRVRKRVPTRCRKDFKARKKFQAFVRANNILGKNIMSSDEVIISCMENTGRLQWCAPGEHPFPRERKRRQNYPCFLLWTAFALGKKFDLVFFPLKEVDEDTGKPTLKGWRMNAKAYRKRCLGRVSGYLAQHPDIWFLQDGASCHTANENKVYFEKRTIHLLQLPPYSPMLNPIEYAWKDLHAGIGRRCPTTQLELRQAAIEAWAEIPQAKLDAYLLAWNNAVNTVATK